MTLYFVTFVNVAGLVRHAWVGADSYQDARRKMTAVLIADDGRHTGHLRTTSVYEMEVVTPIADTPEDCVYFIQVTPAMRAL